jgi:hypothetical protein
VNFSRLPDQTQVDDTFTVTLSGEDVSLTTNASNQVIYFLKKTQTDTSQGSLIESSVDYEVEAVPVAAVNAPVSKGLTAITANAGVISFVIGKVSAPEMVIASLKIKHKRFFKDKTLIDRDLNPTEYVLTPMGESTRVDVQVPALNLSESLSGAKVEIDARVRLNVTSDVANPQAISSTQAEGSAVIKIN